MVNLEVLVLDDNSLEHAGVTGLVEVLLHLSQLKFLKLESNGIGSWKDKKEDHDDPLPDKRAFSSLAAALSQLKALRNWLQRSHNIF